MLFYGLGTLRVWFVRCLCWLFSCVWNAVCFGLYIVCLLFDLFVMHSFLVVVVCRMFCVIVIVDLIVLGWYGVNGVAVICFAGIAWLGSFM